MARKSRKVSPAPRDSGERTNDLDRQIVDRTLRLVGDRGWSNVALGDIARECGVSLATLYGRFPSKTAILRAFLARVDASVLAAKTAADESVRDRLFDLIMRRFDALAPNKAAVRAIVADTCRDPALALCLGPRALRSIAWMAEAAGISLAGPLGLLRLKALATAYGYVLRVWLGDDSSDSAATMATLDRVLKRLEMLENSLPWRRRAAAKAAG